VTPVCEAVKLKNMRTCSSPELMAQGSGKKSMARSMLTSHVRRHVKRVT
jgi:hypothetical protein